MQTGDTIIGIFEGWFPGHNSTPTDSAGTFSVVVDQGTSFAATDHVYAQMYVEANASAGTHVITPPTLGGAGDDGTFYVLLVRGLKTASVVRATGQVAILAYATVTLAVAWTGTFESTATLSAIALTGNTVALTTANAQPGDIVVAISCEDNTTQNFGGAGFSDPPSGWTSGGAQQDAALRLPRRADRVRFRS